MMLRFTCFDRDKRVDKLNRMFRIKIEDVDIYLLNLSYDVVSHGGRKFHVDGYNGFSCR